MGVFEAETCLGNVNTNCTIMSRTVRALRTLKMQGERDERKVFPCPYQYFSFLSCFLERLPLFYGI